MKSLWNDTDAARSRGELGLRAYTSRLLGADPSLVLHGGGNTSVKLRDPASGEDVLYVKSSGSDLAAVDEQAFAPVRLAPARALLQLDRLDNREMARRLDQALLRRPSPRPSIETLLHACLPFRYVEHTHADSVLAVANVEHGAQVVDAVFDELAPLVPYRHSGVELARACAETFARRATPGSIGLILQFHGVVAFGNDARQSYENMLHLVNLAEDYLKARGAWDIPGAEGAAGAVDRLAIAALRARVCRAAGFPLVMRTRRDGSALAFARRHDLADVSRQGPVTPQHTIFTRRVPLLDRDVEGYTARYRDYLERHLGKERARRIDPTPRVALDAELGLCALGVNARYAAIAAEVYGHDMEIISRASAHDRYRAAPEGEIARAELEYGGFEEDVRRRAQRGQPLLGQVALVAPAMHSADRGLARRLADQGAAVAFAGSPEDCEPGEAVLALDSDAGAEAGLDRALLRFGAIDRVLAAPGDRAWRDGCRPLLELSPVAGAAATEQSRTAPHG